MLHEPAPPRSGDEEGVALVYALFATLIITGIVTVLVALAVTEQRDTSRAARYENAIHVAEAGADVVVTAVADDASLTTRGPGDVAHVYTLDETATTADVEEWAIDIATNNCDIIVTGGGEACGIRPVDDAAGNPPIDLVYGVGFVPSRANPLEVRVVRIEYDRGFFSSTKAVLTQGDLTLDGSAAVFGLAGNAHTNSALLVKGSASVQDDLTYSGSLSGDSTGKAVWAPTETVPDSRARGLYVEFSKDYRVSSTSDPETSWYDLCPDGTIRNPSGPIPCTGVVRWSVGDTAQFRGWSFKDTGDTASWSASGEAVGDGVYYVYQGNAAISGQGQKASGNPITMTLVIEAVSPDPVPADGDVCPSSVSPADDGSKSGHYTQTGNLTWNSFLGSTLVQADGDIDVRGTPSATDDFSDLDGAFIARQQFDASGNLTLTGSFISQDACDNANSPVHTSSISGSVDIEYNADQLIPVAGQVRVIAWNEL